MTQLIRDEVGWCALAVSILTTKTPEQAFELLDPTDNLSVFSEKDTEDMIRLKEQGLTFKELGEIYNVHPSSVASRIKRFLKRGESHGKAVRRKTGTTECDVAG